MSIKELECRLQETFKKHNIDNNIREEITKIIKEELSNSKQSSNNCFNNINK